MQLETTNLPDKINPPVPLSTLYAECRSVMAYVAASAGPFLSFHDRGWPLLSGGPDFTSCAVIWIAYTTYARMLFPATGDVDLCYLANLKAVVLTDCRAPVLRAARSTWNSSRGRITGVGPKPLHMPRMAPVLPLRRLFSSPKALADEEAAAKAAAIAADTGAPTVFDKIIKKEIPSTLVYEDEKVLAFRDINPQAPVHIVLIPKNRDGLTQLSKAEPRHSEILGHILYTAKVVAEKEGISNGFRVVINNGPDACQSVYHLHLHIIGGRQMKWPPG